MYSLGTRCQFTSALDLGLLNTGVYFVTLLLKDSLTLWSPEAMTSRATSFSDWGCSVAHLGYGLDF